jgi:hypothetical protein
MAILPMEKAPSGTEGGKFVEVRVTPSLKPVRPAATQSRTIEVRLDKGRSLFDEPGFDASHLRALLSALDTAA